MRVRFREGRRSIARPAGLAITPVLPAAARALLLSLLAAGLAVPLSLLSTLPALAHARYERSIPGDGAVVSAPPARVEIWFTQELFRREGENRIQVEDAQGVRVEVGEAEIDDDDRTHLSVALQPELAPGAYLVSWRSLSAEDGDSDEGEFSFTYDPEAQITSTPMSAETAAAPPTATDVPQATAPPEATRSASPTTPAAAAAIPTSEPTAAPQAGGGCALGLLPVGALLLCAAPAGLRRRNRK